MNDWLNNETIIASIIGGVLTYLGTKTKSKHDLEASNRQAESNVQKSQVESQASTEGIYVQNMELILREYKEQVSSFRAEVSTLRDENKAIRKDLRDLKEERNKERTYYERELELKDEIIDDLNVRIAEKDEIIEGLRSEN